MRKPIHLLVSIVILCLLSACGGGGGGGGSSNSGSDAANFGCSGGCAGQNLSAEEVRIVIGNGVLGAQALGVQATFAVVDRVGNVLALYQMPGAAQDTVFDGQFGAAGGLEGLTVPSTLAAISKAGTGAYLSSQGNAFSTRTASQIIQDHFNPGEEDQPGGPLFGVQFSQLPCGDLNGGSSGSAGPKSLPLGLSADPGGLPLYKNGDLVGGIGVELDGIYRLDRNIQDRDLDPEEQLALFASQSFAAPSERTGDNIFVAGKTLRFTDAAQSDFPVVAEIFPDLGAENFVAIPAFGSGQPRDGQIYGSAASGVVRSVRAGVASAVLTNSAGGPRYPTRGAGALPAAAVDAILDSALLTAQRSRAAIRTPRDSSARVTIFIVDAEGTVLGMAASEDAPLFGIDVALQKARTAAFFSSPDAGNALVGAGLGGYAQALSAFLGRQVLDGSVAFTARAIGNLSRPFFTDGIVGNPNGPLSHPFPGAAGSPSWSPFNTGLQLDLVQGQLAAALGNLSNPAALGHGCSAVGRRLANGIQIFPGSVPLYSDGRLVGAIGISGDGVDQDDLIAYYGASREGLDAAGHAGIGDAVYGFNAPPSLRSDNLIGPFTDTRLRYVNCPERPFIDDNSQNVCDGGV